MKKLTLENWLSPDQASMMNYRSYEEGMRSMNGKDSVELFMDIELKPTVPAEIIRLFEAAKAALCYGWFYNPLYAFGMEQMFRIAETAVKVKCQQRGLDTKKDTFYSRIDKLVLSGDIPADENLLWHTIRGLRNEGSHPDEQMVLPPGHSRNSVLEIARQIDSLFP